MPNAAVMSSTRTYPLSVEAAFDAVLPLPLERIFDRRYGPIPAIRGSDGPQPWGTVGQSRVIRLADGGTMREELVHVQRPQSFGYVLSDVTGPMKPLAARIEGEWAFAPAGTGVRITWSWTVHPASTFAAPALPVFTRLWRGMARAALQRIEDLLVT